MISFARGVWGVAIVTMSVGACGPTRGFADGPSGDASSDGSADGNGCARGEWYCTNGGLGARQCDGMGGAGPEVDCHAMGLLCAPHLGCRTCVPGQGRCDPANPNDAQQCSMDGTQWQTTATCDVAHGQTCNAGTCGQRCDAAQRSYLSCEYFATVLGNPDLPPGFPYAVIVANPQTYATTVSITGGGLGGMAMTQTLMPGQVQTLQLPWNMSLRVPGTTPGALVANAAYHIQSDGPIAAYQFNSLTYTNSSGAYSHTNDASLLLPTQVLTAHYVVASWPGGHLGIVGTDASESGTTVTVRLLASIRDPDRPPTSPFDSWPPLPAGSYTYTLHQGDVVQLEAASPTDDLTGSIVQGDHPFALFGGHDCADVPTTRHYCDHLEEQIFPNETWGHHYAVSALHDRGAGEFSVIRILSERNGNTLTFDGIATPTACAGTLNASEFCEFQSSESFQVTGTQPILVVQYMIGEGDQSACPSEMSGPPDNPICWGDRAMVLEVPVDQSRHAYDFLVPDTYSANFMNVVAPTGAMVLLDGTPLMGTTEPVGSGLSFWFVRVMPGSHHIETMGQTQGLAIKVYGVAPYTSYMYPGGLQLDLISPPG